MSGSVSVAKGWYAEHFLCWIFGFFINLFLQVPHKLCCAPVPPLSEICGARAPASSMAPAPMITNCLLLLISTIPTDSNNKYSITDGIRTQAFYTQSKLCTATPRELVQCPRSLKVEIYSNVTAIDWYGRVNTKTNRSALRTSFVYVVTMNVRSDHHWL